AGTGAGNITATTTGADHGSLNLSGIDSANSVNRFWTLTTGGVTLPAAGYSARFYFINASPVDLDAGATPADFIVQRWSGVSWFTATVNATCPATPGAALCKQVSGVTGFGDFAIGEGTGLNGTPGDFNIFETSTPAGAILGRINTKLHNVPFNLDIVRVNDGRTGVNTGYSNSAVTVELLDARDNTGALTVATNCRSSWTQLATPVSINTVTWTSGRTTISVPALANAAREVRVRVTRGTTSGCSTDRFAIRPLLFTSVTSDMTNATNAGTLIKKTGETFRLTASTGLSGYDNAPAIDNTKVTTAVVVDPAGTVGAVGTVGGAFSPALNGTATSEQFFYSEVGNFVLGINAVVDDSYTAVDQPNDCTPDFSNSAVGGNFGCNFGNPAPSATIGRFTPDNFEVSLNTPEFATACSAGAFTYIGQPFIYAVPPVITVTARNGTNNGLTNEVTRNYTGAAWWKLTGTTEKTYTATSGALAATGITGSDPVIVDRFAATGIIADRGTGTLTFSSGSGLVFTRTTPSAPFNAEIQLSIKIQDSDGVAAATNPVQFGTPSAGIAFSNGNQMRFGRLRLANAAGSELLDLQIPVETQYWSGSAFLRNVADSCTTIAANSVSLTNHLGAVTAANMPQSNVVTGGAFSSGVGVLRLNKPSPRPANKGSVNVCVRLDPATVCNAAVSADLPWLKGKWTSNAEFDDDPAARATFGIQRGGPIIYMREMH
ncbi:MAG: hypothetical protein JWM42_4179, partial [Burkholderia sp.]|nr:hypothetical protein [Burkholderia sp.]